VCRERENEGCALGATGVKKMNWGLCVWVPRTGAWPASDAHFLHLDQTEATRTMAGVGGGEGAEGEGGDAGDDRRGRAPARSLEKEVSEREGSDRALSLLSLSSLFFCARRPTNTPHPSTKTPPLSLTPCAPSSSRPRGEEHCRGSAARSFPISRARTPDRTNKQKSDAPAS